MNNSLLLHALYAITRPKFATKKLRPVPVPAPTRVVAYAASERWGNDEIPKAAR